MNRFKMRLKQWVISFAVLFSLAVLALAAWDWRFLVRVATYPRQAPVTSVDWYDAMGTVPGVASSASELLFVATGNALRLTNVPSSNVADANPLLEAVRYAESRRTAGLLVLSNGEVLLERYFGSATANTRTNSMSMAKTVLALLTGIAIRDGAIASEQDAVGRYLPEWDTGERAKVRLVHLLQMSAGIDFDDDQNDPTSDLTRMHGASDLKPPLLSLGLKAEPGKVFEYNNASAQLLGLVLERATGKSYASYLSEKLWKPLGLADASVWLDRPGGTAKTYCCLFATARDWARLGQLMLERGRAGNHELVPESWIRKMLTPSPLEPDYGYLTWLGHASEPGRRGRKQKLIAADLFQLDGQGKQRVYVIPSRRLVIVRTGESTKDWDDAYLPNVLTQAQDQARLR